MAVPRCWLIQPGRWVQGKTTLLVGGTIASAATTVGRSALIVIARSPFLSSLETVQSSGCSSSGRGLLCAVDLRGAVRRHAAVDVVAAGRAVGVGYVGPRERRQIRGVRRVGRFGGLGPVHERALGDDLAVVVHRTVPETAQFATTNSEVAGSLRVGVGHVVLLRVGIGLHTQLVRPETMNDVERRDVERNRRARGQDQLL